MLSKVIPALDTFDISEIKQVIEQESECKIIKINYEIAFEGLKLIPEIKKYGHKVFLDLKLYDIPNTMYKVCERLNKYNVDYVTVHGEASNASIKTAVDTFNGKILVVCGLTSYKSDTSSLLLFASKAVKNKAGGVICNGHQVKDIKKVYPNLIAFCPGIRLNSIDKDDQFIITKPDTAFDNGADYIICGRSFEEVKNYYDI